MRLWLWRFGLTRATFHELRCNCASCWSQPVMPSSVPVPTEKKCVMCVMPPHESVKTFQRCLRGFSNLRCFHNQFFLVRYLGFARFLMGTGNPASVYWGAQLSDSLLSLAVMLPTAPLYSQVEKLVVSSCRCTHCVKMLKFCPSRLCARGNVDWNSPRRTHSVSLLTAPADLWAQHLKRSSYSTEHFANCVLSVWKGK